MDGTDSLMRRAHELRRRALGTRMSLDHCVWLVPQTLMPALLHDIGFSFAVAAATAPKPELLGLPIVLTHEETNTIRLVEEIGR